MLAAAIGGPLNIIASAVTPAVMISASAILVSGVSTKHSSMSDRMRALTNEYRQETTSAARRRNIRKQCDLFIRRLRLVAFSHMLLYAATGVFSLMVVIISLSTLHSLWEGLLLPLFLLGVAMLLGTAILEILELHLANRVLLLDAAESFRENEL